MNNNPFPDLSNAALFRAIVTPAMRTNAILTPWNWRLCWALGLHLAPAHLVKKALYAAELDAGSWGVDPQIIQAVKRVEEYWFAEAEDLKEKEATRGTNRSHARDQGGRPVTYIAEVASLYFGGRSAPIETCVAWFMMNAPSNYGAMKHMASHHWGVFASRIFAYKADIVIGHPVFGEDPGNKGYQSAYTKDGVRAAMGYIKSNSPLTGDADTIDFCEEGARAWGSAVEWEHFLNIRGSMEEPEIASEVSN